MNRIMCQSPFKQRSYVCDTFGKVGEKKNRNYQRPT